MKTNIVIKGITKSGSEYIVDFEYTGNSKARTARVTRSQLGENLVNGIDAIIDGTRGSSGSLRSLAGYIKESATSIIQIEITISSLKLAQSTYNVDSNGIASSGSNSYKYIYDIYPTFGSEDPYVEGLIDYITDGDTFKVRVLGYANISGVEVGGEVTVRLLGVNSPETKKDFTADWKTRNDKWLAQHGFAPANDENKNMDIATGIADEAKVFMQSFNGSRVVIDPEKDGKLDVYGRLLGVAYVKVREGDGYNSVCVNTSLIANPSKIYPKLSLAEPSYEYSITSEGVLDSNFPLTSWWRYLPNYTERLAEIEAAKADSSIEGYKKFMADHNLIEGETIDNLTEIEYNKTSRVQVGTTSYITDAYDSVSSLQSKFNLSEEELLDNNPSLASMVITSANGRYKSLPKGISVLVPVFETITESSSDELYEKDKLNNTNLVPADSETEDYINSPVDDRNRLDGIDPNTGKNPYGPYYMRIGDCTFPVPPTNIRFDSISSNRRMHSLRSKSSIQIQSGHSTNVIVVDLIFPNIGSVNGKEYRNPIPGREPYYRNGLRPLIAQFKKAPFLPIENELINEGHGIYGVVLQNLELATIPGFPGTVKATLTMLEFDHTVYMPQEEDFAAAFCWPLFRWFYQKSMVPSANPSRTYLKKIDSLNDDILFKLPDEGALNERQQAIRDLYKQIDPVVYERANSAEGTVMNSVITEKNEVESAQGQYLNFKDALRKYPKTKYPALYNSVGVFDVSAVSQMKLSSDKEFNKYKEAVSDIISKTYFSGGEISGETIVYFVMNTLQKALRILQDVGALSFEMIGWNSLQVSKQTLIDIWAQSLDSSNSLGKSLGTDDISDILRDEINGQGGLFVVKVTSNNKKKLKRRIGTSDYYIINPTDTIPLKMLTDVGTATELSFVDYRLKFEEINFRAHMNEAEVPTVDFPIEDIHIQSITAALHNNYAPLQLNGSESPTFQHIGASDAVVDMVIRTKSRTAVEKFRKLMADAQTLAREYRIAITSGVLTIENNIFSMLGIKSVLIERLSIETSNEDKESYLINMSLIAFDKTQRVKEDIDMTQAGGFSDDLDSFYAYTKKRRNAQGFDYAVIDFTLRDLEVYPDLDLPTYKELNADLPLLKIVDAKGTPFRHYPNPDNAKFVDPDFYVRADQTYRDYLLAMLDDGEVSMYLKDEMGMEGVMVGPNTDQMSGQATMDTPNVYFSDETDLWIKQHIDEIYIGSGEENYMIDNAGIENKVYNNNLVDAAKATDPKKATNAGSMGHAIPETILATMTKENICSPLTEEEVIRWGYASNNAVARNAIKNMKDPTYAEVTREIENLVKYYWENLPSDATEIAKGNNSKLPSYTYGKTRISAPTITLEKVINTLKALYDLEHGWKQFNSDGSVCWSATNDIGIGQINVYGSGIVQNLDEARRAAYFWKYNLKKAIGYFAQNYNWCLGSGALYNSDAKNNPLDWAIICYNRGPVSGVKNYSNPQEVDYYNNVMSRFKNKYGAAPIYFSATPAALYDKKIAQTQTDAVTEFKYIQKELDAKDSWVDPAGGRGGDLSKWLRPGVTGGKDPYYKSITLTWYDKKAKQHIDTVTMVDTSGEIEASSKNYKQTDLDRAVQSGLLRGGLTTQAKIAATSPLEQFVSGKISTMCQNGEFDPTTQYVLIKEGAAKVVGTGITNGTNPSISNVFSVRVTERDAVEDVATVNTELAIAPLIVRPDDVGVLFRTSFRDLLEYDARGRLIRAFPTFQMFLIDEGRWMAWHKLWDNFYGYNSITSIDVMKDRRIVADTAVIEMTNIYHNLTTYDSETSYGEWDRTLGDLIWGTGGLLKGNGSKEKVWRTIWDLPDEDILRARRDELNTMMLSPGARINLRMGYGANAYRLPVVFNGTITEMNADEIVTVVAQGDGVELTNNLLVSPNDTTNMGIIEGTKEPREFIGEMLTSKGTFFENLVNKWSGGVFYNTHPLGVVHFGLSEMPTGTLLCGLDIFDRFEEYGECAQNIYSSAGINTQSQWIYTEGSKKGQDIGIKWDWGIVPKGKGDEPNVRINLYDKTPWDILQVYAHACPDYIATVLPFEYRSTIFYGKPWWGVMDHYDYAYKYSKEMDMFLREPKDAPKKALSQMRIYQSEFDIISNGIKASEEFMYTNVMGIYNERNKPIQTKLIQVDSDIYPEKQTTAIVHLPLEADVWYLNKWTQEKYAETAATSALRDYVKDMYQGELVVLGDPTVKPYDMFVLSDSCTDMNGVAEVKRIVHHFSMETGFITSITPDCCTVIDDLKGISLRTWGAGIANGVIAFTVGMLAKNRLWKALWNTPVAAMMRKAGRWANNKLFTIVLAKTAGASPEEIKELEAISNEITDFIRDTAAPGTKATPLDTAAISKKLDEILLKSGKSQKIKASVKSGIVKVAETIKTPGAVGRQVDKLWDSVDVLREARLFKNEGILRKTKAAGNLLFKGTSGLAKFGLKTAGNGSAAIIRGTSAAVAKLAKSAALRTTLVGLAIDIGVTILTANLVESYSRFLKARQSLHILPLRYRGKAFTAGLSGHKGCIVGEEPSAADKFYMGTGFAGGVMSTLYGFLGVETTDYSADVSDTMNNLMGGDPNE